MDLDRHTNHNTTMRGVAGSGAIPGTPDLRATDDGLEPPPTSAHAMRSNGNLLSPRLTTTPTDEDLFGAFSSVTLHHDGELI